ncbi:MAG: hypothetical protein AAFW84_04240 [Cyanobacteria bacterium J06635_15]
MPRWKKWLTTSRLIPLLTILGAGLAVVLSLINVIRLDTSDEIIIALLALVAVDALNERLNVFEKIEARLNHLSSDQGLRGRYAMQNPVEQATDASEICLCAIHGTSAIFPYVNFYANRLRKGCNIRILLLHPESSAVEQINLRSQHSQTKQHIFSTLETLKNLASTQSAGKCEVRLMNTSMPFAMFAVDLGKKSGLMNVEYYSYKVAIDDRPHVLLTASECPYWFTYYQQQFEKIWSDSVIWVPQD